MGDAFELWEGAVPRLAGKGEVERRAGTGCRETGSDGVESRGRQGDGTSIAFYADVTQRELGRNGDASWDRRIDNSATQGRFYRLLGEWAGGQQDNGGDGGQHRHGSADALMSETRTSFIVYVMVFCTHEEKATRSNLMLPNTPRLARSKSSSWLRGRGRRNQYHFSWLSTSAMAKSSSARRIVA